MTSTTVSQNTNKSGQPLTETEALDPSSSISQRKALQSDPNTEENDDASHDVLHVSPTIHMYIYCACAAINSCNIGYDIGVTTSAIKPVRDAMGLNDTQVQMFVGSLRIFSMVGALCSNFVTDNLGRKHGFQVASLWFFSGIVVMLLSQHFATFIIGRMMVGLGVGFGLALDPIYISELATAHDRGKLVTWSEIAINLGILLGVSSGLLFEDYPADKAWRHMIGLGAFLPIVIFFLAGFVMPESPRWLVKQGQDDQAHKVLKNIYPEGFHVEDIVHDIKQGLKKEAEAEHAVGWAVFLHPTPAFRRMFLVGFFIAAGQQAVGVTPIMSYLMYIVEESDIENERQEHLVMIFIALLKLVFIVMAGNLFDSFGRRPLLLISCLGMALSLLVLSSIFSTDNIDASITVVSLAAYMSFFSLGVGPGGWLIPSEVFTTTIRSKAMSIATFLNCFFATIMSSTYLSLIGVISTTVFFSALAIICCILAIFIYCYLPETKGHALEDIAVYFAEVTGDRSILDLEESFTGSLELKSSLGGDDNEDASPRVIL